MKTVKNLLFYSAVLILFSNNNFVLARNNGMDFSSPKATFETHMQACKELDFEKSDLCYTKEFRNFIKTDANYLAHRHTGQLSNSYRYWHGKPYKLQMHGNKAIMRFSPPFTRPEPIYFVKERGEWKIDALFSFKNVIIEDSTHWHWLNPNVDNEKAWLKVH